MIDEEWLKTLRFEMLDGTMIDGVLGTGGTTIVFRATRPDGNGVAVRVERFNLAWNIKEIPTFLTSRPQYDIGKVNKKILSLVGQPYYEGLTGFYFYIIETMIKLIKEEGVSGLVLRARDTTMADAIPLFLRSSALRSRLEEIASLPPEARSESLSRKKAEVALREIAALKVSDDLRPEFLCENPLYVWGGAVMDEVYSDADIPKAAAFITEEYGRIQDHKLATTIITQAGAVADFAAQISLKPILVILRPSMRKCQ